MKAPFIPSIYGIEPLEVLSGPKEALEGTRISVTFWKSSAASTEDETGNWLKVNP